MKVWILIFVCMFSMPLLVAVLHFRMRKGQILKIRQDYVKNARYFGRSFSALVEKALPEMKNGMIMLSKQEKVWETDGRGKMMISYLSEVFEKVYVSNIYEDADLIQNLDEILEKYNIEYIVWAQDVAETGNMSHMMALNPLLKEGGMSDVRTDP